MKTAEEIKNQLSGLIGCVITQVEVGVDAGQNWPVLIAVNEDGKVFQLEISSDEEGNAPGHIFVGYITGDNFENYVPMVNKDSWSGIS